MNPSQKRNATAPASLAINIGPREQAKRRMFGLISLGAGVFIAATEVAFHSPRWMRAIAFLPFWAAGIGLFQASGKT